VNWWWIAPLVAVGGYALFTKWLSTPDGRRSWDNFKLRAPVIGDLFVKLEVARFTRTLGTLSTSGVPILNALNIVKEIMSNVVIQKAVSLAHDDIKEGGGIAKPLSKSKLFPPLAIHLMTVGEETGQMEEMLLKVADVYDVEVRNAVKAASSLVEPILIVSMGAVVGMIVMAMLSAIMSINNAGF
jgi:type II secretory pathway component PulF